MTIATINDFNRTNEVNRTALKLTVIRGFFTPNEPVKNVHAEYHRVIWPKIKNGPTITQDPLSLELDAWETASDEVWNAIDNIAE